MGNFEILNQDSNCPARRGLLRTSHGDIETPVFMPVGTAGAVKGILPQQLKDIGTKMVLANTYHLLLRPGAEVIEKLGGLHNFMAWHGPILTDSGGYQIFSLAPLVRIDEDGVEFTSHIDGAKIYLTPERAIKVQSQLAPDIAMCLDECISCSVPASELERGVERTIRWAKRCKLAHEKKEQQLFAVVQGGIDLSARSYCAAELVKIAFDGYAIGGLSVGEGYDDMIRTVEHTVELLPYNKARYLMGVGRATDIVAAVRAGVDMFDCVLPSRNGRNSLAFTENGPVRLRNSAHTNDSRPIESGCDCYACKNFSRATIRHFFNVGEMLGAILTSIHNLRFYQRLTASIRESLRRNEFDDWAKTYLQKYGNF
ncbi:MAG: tRNA guanosine(34) transglycosylase Tgt [Sedimentisphaerales bacterium]|nr:tRNA guanosine(34) transglycosylase Tgt [Sedimentisphaerales bacterium]